MVTLYYLKCIKYVRQNSENMKTDLGFTYINLFYSSVISFFWLDACNFQMDFSIVPII